MSSCQPKTGLSPDVQKFVSVFSPPAPHGYISESIILHACRYIIIKIALGTLFYYEYIGERNLVGSMVKLKQHAYIYGIILLKQLGENTAHLYIIIFWVL